ncbi:MAG TPA: hypothetical protein PLB62_15120, partial [Candidatus Sumerlaeota bacterium]|nr:hypothetical protein [Candidatus Sumerlaeota bacterium]
MPLLSRTLQKKILVILLIVSIMPAVLGILQTYWGSLIALDGTIGAYMEERAQVMARGVEENLRERLATLSLAGRDERLIRFLSTPSPIIGQPDESAGMLRNIFQDTILSGRDVFVYDMEGECLAASRPDPPVILDAPWLPQAASLGPGDTFAAFVSGPNRQEPRVLFISPMTLPDSPDIRFFLVHDLAMNDI